MYFLEEKLVFTIKIYSQATFVTKMLVVALGKSHETLITNEVLDERKRSTNTSSSLDSIINILSHLTTMQLFCS
jgi:hypothetical protein